MFRWKLRYSAFLTAFILAMLFSLSAPVSGIAKMIPSLCRINYKSQGSIEWLCRRMTKGETLEKVFGDRWVDVARFNRIDRRHVYPGLYLKIPRQLNDIRDYSPMPRHYQPAESEEKFILVDLSEQFLGAYEHGNLVFSEPIAGGTKKNSTPKGEFRVTGYWKMHKSSLYQMENTTEAYPMEYALRFFVDRDGISYWMHGRDLPGYPASHGCIGLSDEEMQHTYYKFPEKPVLEGAKKLFEWAIPTSAAGEGLHDLEDGPKVQIVDHVAGVPVLPEGGQAVSHTRAFYAKARETLR